MRGGGLIRLFGKQADEARRLVEGTYQLDPRVVLRVAPTVGKRRLAAIATAGRDAVDPVAA